MIDVMVKRKSLHETITFSRTLKKIDDSATIKSSGFREQVDKTSLSAASTGSSIKAWRKLLEATLLDPIVWLRSCTFRCFFPWLLHSRFLDKRSSIIELGNRWGGNRWIFSSELHRT